MIATISLLYNTYYNGGQRTKNPLQVHHEIPVTTHVALIGSNKLDVSHHNGGDYSSGEK